MTSSKPTVGVNDLKHLFPEVAKEWHPTRNGELKPTDLKAFSNKKVWWQCNTNPNHEWEAFIYSRTKHGNGCRMCSGNDTSSKPTVGVNDLEHLFPKVAKEWHPTRNGELKPTDLKAFSNKKVWWQCTRNPNHEWQVTISSRTGGGNGCPICSGKKILRGFNDLESTHPEIAKEWHPTRNGNREPFHFTAGSSQEIWWQCTNYPDHAWKTRIHKRALLNRGCLICRSKEVMQGFNDIAFTHPDIAREWHPTKNGDLKPTQFSAGSHEVVWWQCSKDSNHEWDVAIKNRAIGGNGCRICNGSEVLEGFNDLAFTHPKVAMEWHPTRNGDLKPTQFSAGSHERIWWQCSKDTNHEWNSTINNRTNPNNLSGCPCCSDHGFNQGKVAWFYLMYRPGEQQIGITNNLEQRFAFHKSHGWTPVDWTKEPAPGKTILRIEKLIKQWLKENIGLMPGTTENWATTSMEVQTLAELKARSGIETDLF